MSEDKSEEYTPVPPKDEVLTEEERKKFPWLAMVLKILAVVGPVVASPFCVQMASQGFETARQNRAVVEREQKDLHSQQLQKMKIQKEIFDRICQIAEKADMTDPKSIYKMGLIAVMVTDNQKAFGLNMISSEKKLDEIMNQLQPFDELRTKLAKTETQQDRLQARLEVLKKDEATTRAQLEKAKKEYKEAKARGSYVQHKLAKTVAKKEHELAKQEAKRAAYQKLLKRAQNEIVAYKEKLQSVNKELKERVRSTQALKESMNSRIHVLGKIAKYFHGRSKEASSKLTKAQMVLREFRDLYQQAQLQIKKLTADVKDLKKAKKENEKRINDLKVQLELAKSKECKPKVQPAMAAPGQ